MNLGAALLSLTKPLKRGRTQGNPGNAQRRCRKWFAELPMHATFCRTTVRKENNVGHRAADEFMEWAEWIDAIEPARNQYTFRKVRQPKERK